MSIQALYHPDPFDQALADTSNIRYSFLDTFEVIVGSAPNQKRFAVHYKIIERSKFLRTADKSKPIDLHEHDPETFDRYLYCVYRNEMPKYVVQPHLWILSPWSHLDHGARHYVSSINLYVLAGIVVDPATQNLVIDDIMRWTGGLGIVPRAGVVHLVFRSTVTAYVTSSPTYSSTV